MSIGRRTSTRLLRPLIALLAINLFAGRPAFADGAVPDPPAQKATAEDIARAKKLFETGLKLSNEGAFDIALADFEQSYRLAGRPSALRNLAQSHRSLHHFVEAYEAYDALLARHAAELTASEKNLVIQAKDELASLSGTIAITAPAGASVVLDGKPVGTAPLAKAPRVTLGAHKISVSQEGFLPFSGEVTVVPGQDARVDAVLAPEPAVGRIAVRELHERAVHVVIDGKDLGPAPFEGELPAGKHVLEAVGDKFSSERREIVVVKKERAEITLDAVSLSGTLRIAALPASAQIFVDGQPAGTGMFQGDLGAGSHAVRVTADGYKETTRQLTLERGQTVAIDVALVATAPPPRGSVPSDYRGIYVRLNAEGVLGPGMPDNGVPGVSTAGSQPTLGFGGTLRVGYAVSWLSFEVLGSFLASFASQDLDIVSGAPGGGTTTQHVKISQGGPSPNVFVGAGARATTRDDTFRFTFGLAPGVAVRSFQARIDNSGNNTGGTTCLGATDPGCNGGSGSSDKDVGYTTFGLRADAGILMGSTPGTKFFIGLQSWLDFSPGTLTVGPDTTSGVPNNALAAKGRGINVVSGSPQILFGPALGIQWGR